MKTHWFPMIKGHFLGFPTFEIHPRDPWHSPSRPSDPMTNKILAVSILGSDVGRSWGMTGAMKQVGIHEGFWSSESPLK